MRVLVTRSSGQIGTNLALRPRADGHEAEAEEATLFKPAP